MMVRGLSEEIAEGLAKAGYRDCRLLSPLQGWARTCKLGRGRKYGQAKSAKPGVRYPGHRSHDHDTQSRQHVWVDCGSDGRRESEFLALEARPVRRFCTIVSRGPFCAIRGGRRSLSILDAIDPDFVGQFGNQIEIEFLADDTSKKSTHRMLLPVGWVSIGVQI